MYTYQVFLKNGLQPSLSHVVKPS